MFVIKRFFSLTTAFLFCFCICPHSLASEYTGVSTFFSWMAGQGGLAQKIIGYLSGSGCPDSNDGRHHASSYVVDQENGHYTCVCSDCGHTFVAYEEDLEEAESEYVASLPANNISSAGSFFWTPEVGDLVSDNFEIYCGKNVPVTININSGKYEDSGVKVELKGNSAFEITLKNAYAHNPHTYGFYTSTAFRTPGVEGRYAIWNSFLVQVMRTDYPYDDNASSVMYYPLEFNVYEGDYLWLNSNVDINGRNVRLLFSFPTFKVYPLTHFQVDSTNTNEPFNVGTRAASITGNYGIVNSGGTVSQIESQSIVNEGQHTVYNPVTNQTENFTDWNYDYSTRTYTLTQEGGTETTVTYGDEYVTYSNGGNTTNIYYITNVSSDNENSGGGDTPVTPPHQHQYSSVVTTQPTCTRSGVRTYSCTCGASYTEAVPATGHAWEVVSNKLTQYSSSEGVLLEAGYTIYECSVCGQQYRTDDESLPPGIVGQDLQLQEASSSVLSLLPQLKPMYNGYLGMLQETFPYIPAEIMQLLQFGIASCVLIGIWKALRG